MFPLFIYLFIYLFIFKIIHCNNNLGLTSTCGRQLSFASFFHRTIVQGAVGFRELLERFFLFVANECYAFYFLSFLYIWLLKLGLECSAREFTGQEIQGSFDLYIINMFIVCDYTHISQSHGSNLFIFACRHGQEDLLKCIRMGKKVDLQ